MPPVLSVRGLSKVYDGGWTLDLTDADFDLQAGESLAVLGPSGCGKSTLLRLIAGLETPDRGEISADGAPLNGVMPHRRRFGLMHQDLALFPHLNVRDNIEFGLRSQRWPRQDARARVDEMLRLMRIDGLAHRPVDTLSGGEQQRVALARSLAPRPRLLMLDEPLGALDRHLRAELEREIRRIRDHEGVTLVYVTHDHDEAFAVANTVLVLDQGRAVQYGRPEDVYLNPATPFVARFLGHANLFPCALRHVVDGVLEARSVFGSWRVNAPVDDMLSRLSECTALIPPEAVSLGPPEPDAAAATVIEATVLEATLQGGGYDLALDVRGERLYARAHARHGEGRPAPGDVVRVRIDEARIRLLPWTE